MISIDLEGKTLSCNSDEILPLIKYLINERSSMMKVSKQIGVGRESLYKSLSETGNPNFFTVLKIFKVLGFKVEICKKLKIRAIDEPTSQTIHPTIAGYPPN